MTPSPFPCWVDGDLVRLGERVLPADDSAFREGRGCYTTARVVRGHPRYGARHAQRLRRDALSLGIEPVEEKVALRALRELAKAAFGDGEGVVRLQLSRDGSGRTRLVGVPRALGDEPAQWSAILSPFRHPGSLPFGGAKVVSRLHLAMARDIAHAAGVDEAILMDGEGCTVEGTRSNLVVVKREGTIVTPPLHRGAVVGIALEVALEHCDELREGDVRGDELSGAREIVALNALRGARPVTMLEGSSVGDGRPGSLASRLDSLLAAHD